MNFVDTTHSPCADEFCRLVWETNVDQRIAHKHRSNYNQVKESYKELWGNFMARVFDLVRKVEVAFPGEMTSSCRISGVNQ